MSPWPRSPGTRSGIPFGLKVFKTEKDKKEILTCQFLQGLTNEPSVSARMHIGMETDTPATVIRKSESKRSIPWGRRLKRTMLDRGV